ncbi:MAG: VWA domain-containing protein [Actinobacteria bacterium]|nr:VWA domain-containing protein [Actinomycetota bacterium]
MNAIPYSGARVFDRIAARTTVVRVVLAAVLVALTLSAAAAARHPQLNKQPFIASNAGGMLVLDLSASISSDTFSRIGQTLTDIAARGGRYGLVVFSSTAYEALPPGTPASALRPLIRYFRLPTNVPPGEQPTYPVNPWTNSFTGGTQIALGLDLARQIEVANHAKHPAVVLVSDLQDDPNDLDRLTTVLGEYKAHKIALTVIPLNAAQNDLARYVGIATKIIPAELPAQNPSAGAPPHASFPTWLVVLAVAAAALLGMNEIRAARLRWGTA